MSDLIVERSGPVGWLILNRPEVLNAMNLALLDALPGAWSELDADPDVRVIVVTGAGKGFCTGVDVREIAGNPDGMAIFEERTRTGELGLTAIHNKVYKPVITAINGVCAGGGLHFVCDSDLVIASSAATFLDPHVSVGQVSTWEPIGLARRIPFEAAARMLFMGRHEKIDAERALGLGLISQIVDPPEDLRAQAQRLGETIARNSPSAMMVSKKALWDSMDEGLHSGLVAGSQLLARYLKHPDNLEGPKAFVEKREPRWAPPTRDL